MAGWKSDALIVDAVRSPIGKRNGSLASIRGDECCAQVLRGLAARHDLDPAEVEDVQMGCVTQIGEQGWNVGRMVPMVAGWPETVCGTSVDRQCASSMQAAFNAATAVWSGQLDLVIAAGVEMMSRVPMGSNGGDLSPRAARPLADRPAGHLGRGDRGRVEPVPRGDGRVLARVASPRDPRDRRGPFRERDRADRPHEPAHRRRLRRRRDTAPRHVGGEARLAPARVRRRTGRSPRATRARSSTARPPCSSRASRRRPSSASSREPVSSRSASRASTRTGCCTETHRRVSARSRKAGLAWDDMAVIEVNEAFACVVLQFAADAGVEDRLDDVNPNGGGISLGHPLGATGARITATLVNELERRDARYGIATMCIGFGQALAAVIEKL